jgi:hypothetical protein
LHLHIGPKFSAPDLPQTVVDRRAFSIGDGLATGAPRLDLSRGKLFPVLLRPESTLFQQFFKSKGHSQKMACLGLAATHPAPKKKPRQFPAGVSFRELSDDRDQKLR